MFQDSLQLVQKLDTTAIVVQNINNHFTPQNKTIGSGMVVLLLIGAIYTFFIFKRPNK